ncbi:YicC family protein [Bdellovibrionales bacterium]|nr:YicC family protein [Bdellovibrionales bacterium]
MKSMTGFGTASFSGDDQSIDMNIKSVNGRYLDLRFHLPKELAPLESRFKGIIKKSFSRGTVDVYINRVQSGMGKGGTLQVNTASGEMWLQAYRDLATQLKVSTEVDLLSLIELGGLITESEQNSLTSGEEKKLLQLIKEAATNCDLERVREGEALQECLVAILSKLTKIYSQMERLRTQANRDLEKRVKSKLAQFDLDRSEWQPRWALEVSMLVERSDIHEEMVRLGEHISNFQKLIGSSSSQGKKMDFYCQELLRETNTIGSKSQIAKLTHLVVDAKSLIEKLREQVQNVE